MRSLGFRESGDRMFKVRIGRAVRFHATKRGFEVDFETCEDLVGRLAVAAVEPFRMASRSASSVEVSFSSSGVIVELLTGNDACLARLPRQRD